MVIRRTIKSLKERPHDERRGIAVLSSGVVMLILLGAWGVFFVKDIQDVSVQASRNDAVVDTSVQDLAATASSTADIINSVAQALAKTRAVQYLEDTNTQINTSQTAATGALQDVNIPPTGSGDVAAELQAALEH